MRFAAVHAMRIFATIRPSIAASIRFAPDGAMLNSPERNAFPFCSEISVASGFHFGCPRMFYSL